MSFLPLGRTAAGLFVLAASARAQTVLASILDQGFAVADAGDVDGDGRGDLLLGDPFLTVGGVHNTGVARVFSGRTGALLFTCPAPMPGGEMGWSGAGLGDLDGDGKGEFAFGARFASPGGLFQAGEVYVFDGASGLPVTTLAGTFLDGRLGYALAADGELDGDGVPDFLVGEVTASPGGLSGAGRVVAVSGATLTPLFSLQGAAAGDWFGNDVALVGDLDGDGRDEILVGAPLHEEGLPADSQVGRAYLYSGAGPALLATFDGSAAGEWFAFSIARGGDVDGDGTPDLLIGSPVAEVGALLDAGRVRVVSGSDYSTIAAYAGENAGDRFAYGLDGGADVDADGRADLLVGAIGYDSGALPDAGRAYLISGRTGQLLQVETGLIPTGNYGRRVAMIGRADCGFARDYAVGSAHAQVFAYAADCVGAGCPGAGGLPPSLGCAGRAALGETFTITTRAAGPFLPGLLLLGVSSQASIFGPLPFDLAPFGLPGCFLRVSPDAILARYASASGLLHAEIPLPGAPALEGLEFFAQWVVFDPGSANGQFTVSDAGRAAVGLP